MRVQKPEGLKAFKFRVVNKIHASFFCSGSPWYSSLDDRKLARKVKAFLELWNYVAEMPSFVDDLYMCRMQIVHLSWETLDVTNTPPILIETRTTIQPESNRASVSAEVQNR